MCVVLLITLRLDKEIWGLKVLNFACKNKHVSISGLTNVPHFNSTIVLFLCRKLLKVGGLSQQKCSTNCGT